MISKYAVKRLTPADLTFLEWHFRNQKTGGNQKAINLNADVFIDVLYPDLPSIALETGGRLPVDLYIYGPNAQPEHNLQRKIVKGSAYKNWRLDGEFVHNPPEAPARFDSLKADDLAVLEFRGEPSCPSMCRLIFLGAHSPEDADIHAAFAAHLGPRKMASLSVADLETLLGPTTRDRNHPIRSWLLDDVLEDAALGGAEATEELRRSGRTISYVDLKRARDRAEAVGREGEAYVSRYLAKLRAAGELKSIEWVADGNAASPYDFEIQRPDLRIAKIEVKSTSGKFGRPIHVSMAELQVMAVDEVEVFRVYEMDVHGAKLRIARSLREMASAVLEALKALPSGVGLDAVSIDPTYCRFDDAEILLLPEEDED